MAGHGGGTLKGPQQVSIAASGVGRTDLMNADGGGGRGHIMQGFEIQVKESDSYPLPHQGSPLLLFIIILKIILFILGCAGSSLLHGLFSSCGEQGLLFVAE